MNLQKITARHNPADDSTRVFWLGSQAEASAKRAHLVSVEGHKRADLLTEAVDVPTDKAGLLAFLNGCDVE
jgi:hypothetical protein